MENKRYIEEVEELLNRLMGGTKGTDALEEISRRHNGAVVYVAATTNKGRSKRDEEIRSRYTGKNVAELGRLYKLAYTTVRRICKGKG